ncbi:PilZ domain-containing protein [Methylorubrum thiocyanatum]|uniref:PilZ domain-containing protein n=1 Tax=Methylorubrum thiocyanatum TaxID=47958 RepID=A0AA40VD09_9HYPH|nr:PilZ domain-containing protein [Methylorubrum thiocyanatum]MBA8914715.1 hypothetical protein [Methylorubrum thiocyanatum]GJE79128.1 hypothetical protein CJNNKLLH_0454 [Methylorubrum thiocyanatum]
MRGPEIGHAAEGHSAAPVWEPMMEGAGTTSRASAVMLPGRILLPQGEECTCRFLSSGDDDLRAVIERDVAVGSRVVCHVDGLGVVDATVNRVSSDGLRLSLQGSPNRKARLAMRLAWHRARLNGQADRRGADRVTPLDPVVEVALADGTNVSARIADLSATGAALEMAVPPPMGAPLTVGRRRAHVVRRTDAGVAIRFVLSLRPEDVTADIRL